MTTNIIEDGWYDAKAKNWRWKQASTGTWQLEIWFLLSKDGAEVGEMPGWFAVTDNTITKRVEQFTALGYQPKTGDIGQEIGADESGNCFGGLDANMVRAVVKTEPDRNGVEKQKVDNIVAGGGGRGAGQTADQGALRAFGAQMRGAVLAAMAGKGGAQGAQQPQRAAAPQQRPAAPAQQQRSAPPPTRGQNIGRAAPVDESADDRTFDEETIPF